MKKIVFILALFFLVLQVTFFSGCDRQEKKTVYEIECELFDDFTLKGVEKVIFYNDTENTFSVLKFNLFGNAYRKGAKYSPISSQYYSQSFPHGESFGKLEILSVTDGKEPLSYSITGKDENILTIELKEEVFPEESISVMIEFNLKLANVVSRTGYNDSTVNLGNFYPILCAIENGSFYECEYYSVGDPFYSECADYKIKIIANTKYIGAFSGKIISEKTDGDKKTYEIKAENVRSFCAVLSEKFLTVCEKSGDTDVYYYYYSDEAPEKSLSYAVKSLKLFEEKFGKYPYKTYSVVQTKFVQGGMEYPSLVMISDDLEEGAYGEVIVHETAHQWWQTTVGNNEIAYGFLDEGLAEYSVVVFFENYPERNLTRENMIKAAEQTYKTYCSVYDKLFKKTDTTMLRAVYEYKSEYEYVNIAYVKSCIMYEYLRKTIGDERFFDSLKKYYKNYLFKIATPDDLVGSFEKTGADSNGFFEGFFNGKVII